MTDLRQAWRALRRTPAFLVAIGMLASFLPARRASRVDPIESLRSD